MAGSEIMIAASYGIAAVAYALFALWLALGWRAGRQGVAFIAAAGFTALWGAVGVATYAAGASMTALGLAGLARTGSWLLVLLATLRSLGVAPTRDVASRAGHRWRRDPLLLLTAALLAVAALDDLLSGDAIGTVLLPLEPAFEAGLFARLGLAVLGLVLVENVYAATGEANRWSFKHLLIGLGGLFAFDLYLYSEALLFRGVREVTALARPLVATLILPFLLVAAVRVRRLSFDVTISRSVALRTTALAGSGIYLLAVAGIGYVLRETGLAWGPLLQLLFLVGAVLVLAVLLLSGEVRARYKTFISRHFFSLAYDYRAEWLRFIRTMSGDTASGNRYERAIRAVADVFECASGALFLRGRGDVFSLAARWNWSRGGLVALPNAIADRLDSAAPVLDLRRAFGAGGELEGQAGWGERMNDPWLLVPVRARERVIGALVLSEPRAPRRLTWEDDDLLDILGLQIGSYIAEEQATRALVEAQRFERVSRNFTFVAHDLKNLVSQLSLILQHAERHGDNPEFQRDALATVGGSVERMRAMLVRLRETAEAEPAREVLDLRMLLKDVVEEKRLAFHGIRVDAGDRELPVDIDRDGFAAVAENLIQNAVEAAGRADRVRVACRARGAAAVLEVADAGPGMTRDFIEKHLFQPFASTKRTGFGIGMYQSREMVERWGGRFEVESEVGAGTTVRVTLPLATAGLSLRGTPRAASGPSAAETG